MADEFKLDVFLSHSTKNGVAVCPSETGLLAFPPGFQASDVECPFLSARLSTHALDFDLAQLEAGTFRFHNPLDQGYRVIHA